MRRTSSTCLAHAAALTALLAAGACSAPQQTPEPKKPISTPIKVVERPEPLPWVDPPADDWAVWTMPTLPHLDPPFPRLVGEPVTTHSVGDVSDGWLANAVPIPRPHPNLAILQVQRERGLHFTTPEMLDLLEKAASHVQKSHPGSPVWLGNFSAPGGGDIPYSVSHNSGRDADVGFYMIDEKGRPVEASDLYPLDRRGRYEAKDGTVYRFDVARNWAFVEGLMRADAGRVQYIFISRPLRRMLIRYAREQGVDNRYVAAAARRLMQPMGALPHNDHFHIRIFCDPADLAFGCEEQGRLSSRHRRARDEGRAEAERRIRESLASSDPMLRAAAVRRGAEMRIGDGLADAMVDPSPVVRAAAVRAYDVGGISIDEVVTRLRAESDPRVFAEVVASLSESDDPRALEALIAELDNPRSVDLPAKQIRDGRLIVVQALAAAEVSDPVPALIAQIDESDSMQTAVLGALRQLTNVRAPDSAEPVEWWRAWWKANAERPRDEWLAAGFRQAGYAVEKVDVASIWGLVRAVRDERPWIRWNAQRSLQRMSTSDAPTLTWPDYDAWYYWRWWFQKKTKLRDVPDPPEELDVDLHPYESPEERGEE